VSDYDLFNDYEADQPATLEEERPPRAPRQRRRPSGGIYGLVTAFFLLATLGSAILTVALILNPTAPFNPLPPPTPQPTPTLFLLGSGPAEASLLPPTWTPSPSAVPGPTSTRQATPTRTPTPQATATGVTPLPGATNTIAVFPFTLQNEAVTYSRNENSDGCAWLSIAGQVFDLNQGPVRGLPVQVTGEGFQQIEFSGNAPAFGPSGYEVFLNTTPVEAEYVVQLLNTTGMPLSEPIVVRTLSACDRNVAIVNFVQNHEFSR
jgi:hypothetical protein